MMRVDGASTTLIAVALIVAFHTGCARDVSADVQSLQSKVDRLTNDLNEATEKIAELNQYKTRQAATELREEIARVALLRPGDDGYSTIRADIGVLTVSLENIEAYANGSRATLQWGNTTGASLTDVTAQIDWGIVDAEGIPVNQSAKSKQVKFTEAFRPGAWARTQVVLDGVPPTSLGFVRVKEVTNTGIRLNR